MGLNMTRLARPFRANEIVETLHPGLRALRPGLSLRRFAATMAHRFAVVGIMDTLYCVCSALGYRCAPLRGYHGTPLRGCRDDGYPALCGWMQCF